MSGDDLNAVYLTPNRRFEQGFEGEVAERLEELGVPFVFASGYGEELSLPASFSDARTLAKPFAESSVRNVLSTRRKS